ncbi:MAG: DUF2007 domain-containing protein [Sedimentisphaerales bacterium]|nr:DUF2007 domain-containing protein [Sedimentisphaerales bacterium]
MDNNEKIITVARFNDYLKAEMVKTALESEGIKCFVGGDNFVATYGLYSNAVGGVELCILESDKQKALEILQGMGEVEKSYSQRSSDLQCPECKSTNIYCKNFFRWACVVLVLFFCRPLLKLPPKKYICRDCGHKWEDLDVELQRPAST